MSVFVCVRACACAIARRAWTGRGNLRDYKGRVYILE